MFRGRVPPRPKDDYIVPGPTRHEPHQKRPNGYRMSKTALNAAGRSLAHDLQSRGFPVVLLHPGYVRTQMTEGRGFMEADESAALLLARIDELTLETTGTFWHTNGEIIPW